MTRLLCRPAILGSGAGGAAHADGLHRAADVALDSLPHEFRHGRLPGDDR